MAKTYKPEDMKVTVGGKEIKPLKPQDLRIAFDPMVHHPIEFPTRFKWKKGSDEYKFSLPGFVSLAMYVRENTPLVVLNMGGTPSQPARCVSMMIPARRSELAAKFAVGKLARILLSQEQELGYIRKPTVQENE